MDLNGKNVVVLDLETLHSVSDCRVCGGPDVMLRPGWQRCYCYSPIGWENKAKLGLSIGCYWSYKYAGLQWFDTHTLQLCMQALVHEWPLLVSFNGINFDFPLMRALIRAEEEGRESALCNQFKALAAQSYDILAELWKADPRGKSIRGLNSLDSIAQANGLEAKSMDGAAAPRLWQQGRHAEVISYNVSDSLKTKYLFEMICEEKPILRGDGKPIRLPMPSDIQLTLLNSP